MPSTPQAHDIPILASQPGQRERPFCLSDHGDRRSHRAGDLRSCQNEVPHGACQHEGRLTSEVFKGYRKLAQRMNQERIAHEKELKKLQGRG